MLEKMECGVNYTTNLLKETVNSLIDQNVSGIKSLGSLTVYDGMNVSVNGFYVDTVVGGGNFVYDASKDKALHNGGTIIAPEAIAAWDGLQTGLTTLLNWTGTGSGCFVRSESKDLSVEAFGAVADGVSDSAAPFLSSQNALGCIRLLFGMAYKTTALPSTPNLIIKGSNSVIFHSGILVDRQFDNLDISGVIFDGQGSNFSRSIRVRGGSIVKFRKVEGKNINSNTFLRVFDFSTENVNLDLGDMFCSNISAAENAVIGDLNGSCRFIYIGDETAAALVQPSYGRIINISGNGLLPKEDGDMIHIQSSDQKLFEIEVSGVSGINIAKRLVKVQANGVYVNSVNCDSRVNPVNMYSVVSHYGKYGSVTNISGVGKLDNGVDTLYPSTKVSGVICINSGTVLSQGAGFKSAGGCSADNVYSEGFEHVVGVYANELNTNIKIRDVRGSCTGVPVYIRAQSNVKRLYITDVDAATSGNSRIVHAAQFGGSSATFANTEISKIRGETTYFTSISVDNSLKTSINDVEGNSSSELVYVSGGTVEMYKIKSLGTAQKAVRVNGTTRAILDKISGGTVEQIRTQGCNNTIATTCITSAGIPIIVDEVSNPSTNSQTLNTITLS